MKSVSYLFGLCVIFLLCSPDISMGDPGEQTANGLNPVAMSELSSAGVDKYMGQFEPMLSEDLEDGWVRHTFDTAGGSGPICVAGTPYTTFTKLKNPSKLMIMLQGGGACWQDFYVCNILSDILPPPLKGPGLPRGIWADEFDTGTEVISNPLADWSVVSVPYCDGSVHIGDNEVVDANFPFAPTRYHRGLRNLTAAIDLARDTFPNAGRILLAGSSAGGYGAGTFAPFLARFAWGNTEKLMVLNDAGPLVWNLDEVADVQARANDWQFGQFFPASCSQCSDTGQLTEIAKWRLSNDTTIREALYSTDGDSTIRFFLNITTHAQYRALLLSEHDALNLAFPDRYKRFIRRGDFHTVLGGPGLYLAKADGIPLDVWIADFLVPRPFWIDIVEDYIPIP
jgi:hypothetical protein